MRMAEDTEAELKEGGRAVICTPTWRGHWRERGRQWQDTKGGFNIVMKQLQVWTIISYYNVGANIPTTHISILISSKYHGLMERSFFESNTFQRACGGQCRGHLGKKSLHIVRVGPLQSYLQELS